MAPVIPQKTKQNKIMKMLKHKNGSFFFKSVLKNSHRTYQCCSLFYKIAPVRRAKGIENRYDSISEMQLSDLPVHPKNEQKRTLKFPERESERSL